MRKTFPIAQFFLRISLGLGFLLPVLDRIGYFGGPGDLHVSWGDWANFVAYTHLLMPYVNLTTASYFGFAATVLEMLFGILLVIGYKTRYAALGSFALTLIFALSMMIFLHFRSPFNFSVFVVSFSSLMLAAFSEFPWSVDAYVSTRSKLN